MVQYCTVLYKRYWYPTVKYMTCYVGPGRNLDTHILISMASFFGLGGPAAKVEIALDSDGDRKTIDVESDETKQELMIYSGDDKVSGTVKVIIPSGKKLEHLGIKVEVIGTVGTSESPPQVPPSASALPSPPPTNAVVVDQA